MKITKDLFKEVNIFNIPDDYKELLALSPNGTLHLTYWRPEYGVFSCMNKGENPHGWKYVEIDLNL